MDLLSFQAALTTFLKNTKSRYSILILSFVLLSSAVIFAPLIFAEFVGIDDKINIIANKNLQELSMVNIKEIWSAGYRGMYIPLTYTVWAFIAEMSRFLFWGKITPEIFHLFNIVFHCVNIGFVYYIILFYLQHNGHAVSPNKRAIAAGIGTLFFALHPIQVEAAAWATGMKDLLSSFFSLLTIYLLLRLYHQPNAGIRKTYTDSVLILPIFLAALLAKPSAVIIPLVILVLSISCDIKGIKKYIVLQLPYLAFSLAFVLIARHAQPAVPSSTPLYSFFQGPLLALDALFFYWKKILWPDFFILDYGRNVSLVLEQSPIYFAFLMVALAIILGLLAKAKFLPPILVFIIGVSPTLGFMPFWFQRISITSDRYVYFAMLGAALCIAKLLVRFPRRYMMVLLMAAILVLGYKGIQQVKYWQNSYQLMGHVLNYNPQSPLANLNYGIALMKRGDYQGAIAYTTKATQLSPDNPNTYYNLGLSYIFAQNLEKAQEQHRILLKRAPELAHKFKEAMEEIPRQLGRSP